MSQLGNHKPMRTITLEEHYATPAFMEGPGRQLKDQAQAAHAHPQVAAGLTQLLDRLCDLDDRRIADMDAAGIDMQDFRFDKPEVSIAPGGQVTWKNKGNAQHTASFDDVQLDTGNVAPGATGRLAAPTKPASYSYRCNIHPGKMRGVLVVVGENVADPTKPAAAY